MNFTGNLLRYDAGATPCSFDATGFFSTSGQLQHIAFPPATPYVHLQVSVARHVHVLHVTCPQWVSVVGFGPCWVTLSRAYLYQEANFFLSSISRIPFFSKSNLAHTFINKPIFFSKFHLAHTFIKKPIFFQVPSRAYLYQEANFFPSPISRIPLLTSHFFSKFHLAHTFI